MPWSRQSLLHPPHRGDPSWLQIERRWSFKHFPSDWPSLLPVFTEHSFACLDMHHFVAIYFLGWITEKLSEWYPDADYAEERRLLYMTLAYAEKIGVIRFPDRPNTTLN